MKTLLLIHPILSGIAGFCATVIGSNFFKLEFGHAWLLFGLTLFLLANQLMLKFQFNSYQLNGATVTTVLSFLSQVACITFYKREEIDVDWMLGVTAILTGTLFLKTAKNGGQIRGEEAKKRRE